MSKEQQQERDEQESDTNSGTLGDILASVVARVDALRVVASETVAPAEPGRESGTKAVGERTTGTEGEQDPEAKR